MTEFDPLTTIVARGLVDMVISLFNRYIGTQLKLRNEKRVLPYISKEQVMKDLDIKSDNTMTTWEDKGLQRYKPNYNSSKIYYLIDDVCKFIVLAD